jgi:signal transduction histidine kinase
MGHIDLALSNNLADEYRAENLEGLHIAEDSGKLLILIIEDILALSKIEAGQELKIVPQSLL